jgi:methanogenic corrinoid protein MtbC1
MTTENTSTIDEPSKRLTEMILKGEEQDAARIAGEIVGGGSETNDIVDAISETMNIVADLHEVDRYTVQQVENCERAAESALNAIRPGLKVEQRRVSGRVMVTSLHGDPHKFDKTLLLTMLEMGGFSALDGGEELSPEEIVRYVKAEKPDVLAIPLVTPSAVNDLMRTRSLLANSGVKTKLVTYGRGVTKLPSDSQFTAAEEDSLSILSKIAEILIAR